MDAYLAQREATCPACAVHVAGVGSPYLCPGCGHRLSLGLKGVRALHIARPWMLALFGLGVLALGPIAAMVIMVLAAGNGDLFSRNVLLIVWALAAVVGTLVSGYAIARLLGRPSPRAMAGDLGEYRWAAWGVLGCAAVVAVGRFVVPVLGVLMP